MSNNNGKRSVVEIKENPVAAKPAETTETNGQETPAEANVKYTFGYCLRHPIKATKHAFEEHPVAATVTSVGLAGALAFGAKCLASAFGGDDSEDEDDEELEDELEDEDENNEEDEI